MLRIKFIDMFHVKTSSRILWSNLSKVGGTPALRLTVLVPLIGIFLIFNEQTEKLFIYPDFFREDLGLSIENKFSTTNLYFTYFGLCFLGIASAMFALLCPKEIANQPNQQDYLLNSTSIETPVIAKGSFRELLDIHFANEDDNVVNKNNDNFLENPEYPHKLEGDFHSLMEELHSEYEVENDDFEDDQSPEVMMATGYLDFTEFARMLWSNPRVVWVYTIPFFALTPKFAKDIAYLKYQALDYTRYYFRLSISCMYAIGFLLLLVPTAKVFFLLGYNVMVKLF
jgi:hypothetical protein